MIKKSECLTPKRRIKVALVEDHNLFRHSLARCLEDSGDVMIVASVDNGNALIDSIQKLEEVPDICIVDLMMPELDGFETTVKLRERWPDIRILFSTALTSDAVLIRMIGLGVHGYLPKGCSLDDFETGILDIFNHGRLSENPFNERLKNRAVRIGELFAQLTPTEMAFLKVYLQSKTNPEIAQELNIPRSTAEFRRRRLCEKLEVKKRNEVFDLALAFGLMSINEHTKAC